MKVQALALPPLVLLVLMGCRDVTGPTSITPLGEVTRFDAPYGQAPAAGWRWGVAVVTTGAQELTEATDAHNFAWVFYVLRGSTEIGSGAGRQVLTSGQAAIVPARQEHTHRVAAQSQILLFRPADRPFGEFHRGTRLYESEAMLPVTAGQNYRIRIREQTLSARSPGSVSTDTGFAYVIEGGVAIRDDAAQTIRQTGQVFALPPGPPVLLRTADARPARVVLVDLH